MQTKGRNWRLYEVARDELPLYILEINGLATLKFEKLGDARAFIANNSKVLR